MSTDGKAVMLDKCKYRYKENSRFVNRAEALYAEVLYEMLQQL